MFDQARCKSCLAFAATSLALAVLTAGHTMASQGPGGGPGTAGAITQTMMAIVVYGGSAGIAAVALIGALRQR